MKGAKRILSVFLLVVMLCTFFAFPAEAATNFWPSNFEDWQRENLFVAGTGGNVLDLRGDPPKLGSAVKQITLVGGRTYRITGTLIWRPSFSESRITIGLITDNGEEVILCYFDGVSRNIEVDVEFTVPSNNQVEMAILIYGRSTVTFNDFVLEDDSTDKGILNSIKEGFAKLWEWLQNIWNTIKEIPTKIGQFITNLGDRISTFFSNLTNSIKGFFTDLWDKIWNGDGSVPPFDNNNKFAQVIEKLNEWTAKIKEFSGSVDSSADTVTGYLQSGTSFLNSAMGAFPAALTAVLGFALVFIVVRKVVGR